MNLSRLSGAILTLLFLTFNANASTSQLNTLSYDFPLYANGVTAQGGGASAQLITGGNTLNIEIFCDDFAHQIWVPYGPPTYPGYTVNVSGPLTGGANLSNTRFGGVTSWNSVNIAGDATDTNTINNANALARYQMVAYLVMQYHTQDIPTNDAYNNGIQEAIWTLMNPTIGDATVTPVVTLPNIGDATTGLKQAAQWYTNSQSDKSFLASFQVITQTTMYNCGAGEMCGGFQEQLFDPLPPPTVPEPRGQLVVILGLLGLCAFKYQRSWKRS
jgi:hypothetical protein